MPDAPEIPEELPLADGAAVIAEVASASDGETPETTSVPETTKEHDPMLDVHPAHHAASTWKEFFIHIATIVLGLLIAVGLEQTVEAIHHRHQRAELIEQMHAESEHNLPVLEKDINTLAQEIIYMRAIHDALVAGKVTAAGVDVAGVPAPGVAVALTGASRATWQAAQGAGLPELLPAELQKVYVRLDDSTLAAEGQSAPLFNSFIEFVGKCDSAGYNHFSPAISHITVAEQKDLINETDKVSNLVARTYVTATMVRGANEAIVARVTSVDQVYRYQTASVLRPHAGLTTYRPMMFYGNLFGGADAGHMPSFGANGQPK